MSNTESTLVSVLRVCLPRCPVAPETRWVGCLRAIKRISAPQQNEPGAKLHCVFSARSDARRVYGYILHICSITSPEEEIKQKWSWAHSTHSCTIHRNINKNPKMAKVKRSCFFFFFFQIWFSRCKNTCLFGKEPDEMSHHCDFSSTRVKICDTKTIILTNCALCRHCVGCQNNCNGIYFTFPHRAALWHVNTTEIYVTDICWVESTGHMNELLV